MIYLDQFAAKFSLRAACLVLMIVPSFFLLFHILIIVEVLSGVDA